MHFIFEKRRPGRGRNLYTDTVIFRRGKKTLKVAVSVEPQKALSALDLSLKQMREAEDALKAMPSDDSAQEKYGGAVLDFIAAVFGHDNTIKIVEFYTPELGSMIQNVKPYILSKAIPKIKKLARKESGFTAKGGRINA